MPYFDLHCHPSMKSFLSNNVSRERPSCWSACNSIVDMLASQSNLSQAQQGKLNIGVAAMITIEQAYSTSFMLQNIVPELSCLDRDMLNRPEGNDGLTYFIEEIRHLQASLHGRHQDARLIKHMGEYQKDGVNLILAIEGAHTIQGAGMTPSASLKALKEKGEYRFLYITIVHQTNFITCSHAYSVKMLKGNKQFRPQRFGLQEEGKKLIDVAYDQNMGGHRIYIDLKHMSLVSRKNFYAYRKEKGYEQVPIIASHMGLAGMSWNRIDDHIRTAVRDEEFVRVKFDKPKGLENSEWKSEFNPWSVNLYDEEIPIIIASDGLIGLILDRRVLGAKGVAAEYFHPEEFKALSLSLTREDDGFLEEGDFEGEKDGQDTSKPMSRMNAEKDLWHLCNQIVHAVRCGGPKTWAHLCIGSDFDGLISPIKACKNLTEMFVLEQELPKMLPRALQAAAKKYPGFDFKAGNIQDRVQDILFNNARRFLEKHFQASRPPQV
jgi:microsomal dipeptidase-like Zn-dependent dipeptidase